MYPGCSCCCNAASIGGPLSALLNRCVIIVWSGLDFATWCQKWDTHSTGARDPVGSQLGEFIEVSSLNSLGDISVQVICLPRVKKVVALLRVHNPR